jgi:hypothetical protein
MPPTPPNYKLLARQRMKRGLSAAAIAARERAQANYSLAPGERALTQAADPHALPYGPHQIARGPAKGPVSGSGDRSGAVRLSNGTTVPSDMVDRVRERFRQEGTLDEHAAAIRQRSISAAAQALAQLPRNPRVGSLTSPTDILKRRKNIRY